MDKKILFVDDESSIRRTMTLGLRQQGYDIEPCENGINALKKLELYIKNNIHLDGIVVDLRLPDIDGIKLVKIMKFKCPGVPIVMISGYADQYSEEEIRNLQIGAFLEKPLSPEEIGSQLVELMEEQLEIEALEEAEMEPARCESAYLLLGVNEEKGFMETYQALYAMEPVVYCDTTKGDYDIFMLVQGKNREEIQTFVDSQVKQVAGVDRVEILDVQLPVLDEAVQTVIRDAEEALEGATGPVRQRDLSRRVTSYLLVEAERERMNDIYPALRLDEQVVYCDYTDGRYNLVLMVTGSYFDDIDRFVKEKVSKMEGILKVKEYPIISMFEM